MTRAELSEVLQRVWPFFKKHRFMSRPIFVEEKDVEYISIRDGSNGNRMVCFDKEKIHEIVERLNNFRTDQIGDGRRTGYEVYLRIVMKQIGSQKEIKLSPDGISVGRVGYHSADSSLFSNSWINEICQRESK